MRFADLVTPRDGGIWCEAGGFHIDPGRAVDRAIVTHAHSDHCRPGHKALLATPETAALAAARLGRRVARSVQTLVPGARLRIGDATVRLAPAGHVLGSVQVVIEAGGRRAVVSGDYKRTADPSCAAFEPQSCDLFVTEATFGLPVYRHPEVAGEIGRLLASLRRSPRRTHLLSAYSLGKAQRMMAELRRAGFDDPFWLAPSLEAPTAVYEAFGVALGPVRRLGEAGAGDLAGAIVLAPPGAATDNAPLHAPLVVTASGWMRIRRLARSRGGELALVISDHADWPELGATIRETGAGEVRVTHGREDALVHWCRMQGIAARALAEPAD